MEKYEQHGLTRLEDDILGGFGLSGSVEEEELNLVGLSATSRDAARSLLAKGLLTRQLRDDDSVVYKLTPKGTKLWHIRSEEETQTAYKR